MYSRAPNETGGKFILFWKFYLFTPFHLIHKQKNYAYVFFHMNKFQKISTTPGPHLMRIHLVRYSTSARYEKYSNIHLVRPIIHLVRIFALSTS